nr:hypothetical protein [Tanacetum cinerariifolium]
MPEVEAAAVASPARVLELDTHSSSEADPSESSPPPVYIAPMVSPFLCLDNLKSDTEIPKRHVSPTTSTLEILTAPILPAPSAIIAPPFEFPLAPVVSPPGIRPFNGGNCLSYSSVGSENEFFYDPNPYSYNETPNFYNQPPQHQYATNSCEFYGNDAHYGYDCPPQVLGPHETFQCQPLHQNFYEPNHCYNSNSFGFEQSQPPQFPIIHQPSQETSVEILHDQENNHPAFYNNDEDDDKNYTNAITPDFLIMNSLSMGDEHLSTIPKTESDELIKSSVENLVPNPSKSKDLSDIKSSSIIYPKFDSLLEEFSSELAHIDLILSGINEADFDPEEEIRLAEKLLYDNSSPRPSKEPNSKNSDAVIEYVSSSPILVEDSDSLMDEINLFLTLGDSMPLGFENADYDSEGDIFFLEEFLSNDSPSLPKNESFHFDIPPSPRQPVKPPDDDEIEPDTKVLTTKVVGDISEHYVLMPRLLPTQPTLCLVIDTLLPFSSENKDKVHLLSHRCFKAFQFSSESPMMIYGGTFLSWKFHFSISILLDKHKYGGSSQAQDSVNKNKRFIALPFIREVVPLLSENHHRERTGAPNVMAILVISVSPNSSKDSMGAPAGRVILFGTIPTTISDTTPVIAPPTTQTDTTVITKESPITAPTIPPSPDYTPASLDYSTASETGDTPDTPPSPTHDTPFTEITASTLRTSVIPHRRVMILAPGQPIPHGRPYCYYPNGPVHMMNARKRVGPLPVQQLAVRHSVDHSSSDSSSRHSLSDHSSPDLSSTSAGPSRKRRRSPMISVPALPPVSRALSPVYADLIPLPKRVRDIGCLADVKVGPRETRVERVTHPAMPKDIPEPAQEGAAKVTYETLGDLVQRFHDHTQAIPVHHIQVTKGVQREQGHRIIGVESVVTVLTERVAEMKRDNKRLRGTASVESQRVDRLQRGMSRMQREIRASMTHGEVEELVARRVAEEMEARKAARNLKTLNENEKEQEGENGGNENGGNGGNGNRDNGGNENGGNRGNGNGGNEGNVNHGMNYGGNAIAANPARLQDAIRIANQLMDKKLKGYAARSAENKRRMESNPRDNHGQQPSFKRQNTTGQNVARAYMARNNERKGKDCPKTRSQNCGNQTRNKTGGNEVIAKDYAIGRGGTNHDSNVVT